MQQDEEFLLCVITIPNHCSDGVLSNRLNPGKGGKTDIRTHIENSVAEFWKGWTAKSVQELALRMANTSPKHRYLVLS